MAIFTLRRPDGDASAAAPAAVQPGAAYIGLAGLLVIVGLAVGWPIQHAAHPVFNEFSTAGTGLSVLAVVYILAQTIERLLEPVSWFGGGALGLGSSVAAVTKRTVVSARDRAVVAARTAEPEDLAIAAADAAAAQADVDQYRANLGATSFGVAAFLALIASGSLGILLLRSAGVTSAPVGLDLLITGLALAGATKPLHDLISYLARAVRARRDPVETG
jgi:hypothetical protein